MSTARKSAAKDAAVRLYSRWIWSSELPLGGISKADLHALVPAATRAHHQIRTGREKGQLGFLDLAREDAPAWKDARRAARQVWKKGFKDLLVLGIGGSALGTKALQQALAPHSVPGSPVRAKPKAGTAERVWVLDNIDPGTVLPVLDRLDPKTTLVNVVSKSGGTVETLAQLLILAKRFQQKLGKRWAEHFVFTTDPNEGELRRLAEQERIAALDVPPNVGGRFSVLTAVGLFPAALMGVNGQALLRGAQAMRARCEGAEVETNPAYLFAAAHVALQKSSGIHVSVLFPYCDRLYLLGQWFSQLWAESLGKRQTRTGKDVRAGFTPAVAVGVTDQHSQLQLYLEGPRDKLVTFLSVSDLGRDVSLPALVAGSRKRAQTTYLGGRRLGELFAAERDATKAALARNGIPVLDLLVPQVTPEAMGELIVFFEIATVFAGELLGINPLDQPAVEQGKRYANALLGKPGFEQLVGEVAPYREIDKQFLL